LEKSLILNVGLRYEYFDPSSKYNPRLSDELSSRTSSFLTDSLKNSSIKHTLSPRISIAYPITDQGVIRFSYGHFYQLGNLSSLYTNSNFRVAGSQPIFGNADVKPQRSIQYEIGLQQELAPNLGITVTGYYKDIRNLLGIQIHIKNDFKKFGEYVNRDYGAVQGFTISLERRLTNGFGANVDYTYQIAKGNASDPNDDFNRVQANPPVEINKQLVALNWDRRHSLNLTVTAGDPDNLLGSFIARLGSGLPYTPALQNQRTGLENSDNRPAFFNADLYVTQYLNLFNLPLSLFVKVYNVFDTVNELNVFSDTGRAGYTLELTRAQQAPRGVNTLEEYFTRSDFFSAPRQVVFGTSVLF
ncbi:MAG: Outer rane receptor protein, mostly Fe transport, partial [Bacteroidetes bacterium]|nr:Outer rane receptor protein, mostly Fe transport [Bacteroidota bacterium]